MMQCATDEVYSPLYCIILDEISGGNHAIYQEASFQFYFYVMWPYSLQNMA